MENKDNMEDEKRMENYEKMLELARIVDATLEPISKENRKNGQTFKEFMKFLIQRPGFSAYVGDEFYNHCYEQIKEADNIVTKDNNNVYGPVKKMMMYPTQKYLPWDIIKLDVSKWEHIQDKLKTVEFKLELNDEGKVYAYCKKGDIVSSVFNIVKSLIEMDSAYIQNTQSQHITVINSDVVAHLYKKISKDKVQEFVNQFCLHFSVGLDEIKHTISKDYSPFRGCYVAGIHSIFIDDFIRQFNKEFKDVLKKPVDPSLHITFAIERRNLFQDM